ncbi:sarcosine oxidase subunit gamma [Microbaculum marinum]|uniref:Sarcosine oxidase subunit gamma family protein n=1 Tax=Microbaculum marinum TaxID=1764581 RepID=A0AAW9RLJ1_9HYPH
MSDARRRSPLGHRKPIRAMEGAARMVELPFIGKLALRVDPQADNGAVRRALGVPLPADACTATRQDETAILWIGPDEFWVITPRDGEAGSAKALEKELATIHHQVVDVTSYYTVIELAGPRAAEMLMKLTTLDLHRRAFVAGQVAGSMFGAAQATLWQVEGDEVDGGPTFRLLVRRTMADYLWCLLAEAGFEWGMPKQAPLSGETWRLER